MNAKPMLLENYGFGGSCTIQCHNMHINKNSHLKIGCGNRPYQIDSVLGPGSENDPGSTSLRVVESSHGLCHISILSSIQH